jgi:hypothetical protein
MKECLAVEFAVKYFEKYLKGVKFDVFTGHKALTALLTKPELYRWVLTFAAIPVHNQLPQRK